jgi:membrane protease YdiL (CAAX protease family)
MRKHPVLSFAVLAIVPTWAVQFFFLAQGWPLLPAIAIELVFLLGAATFVTARTEGREGVKRLYARAVRWRIGLGRFAVVLLAIPALTLAVAAVTGSVRTPAAGWGSEIYTYLFLTLVFGAVLGNVWEETAWAGFAQSRLMERYGVVKGSVLTAIPFALIHLPLAFEEHGLAGTSGRDLAITWGVLIVGAPFFRYVYGTTMLDAGGSVLAVAIIHASFNATQKLGAVHGQWPPLVAMLLMVVLVAAYRSRRTPAPAAAAVTPELTSAGTRRPGR